MPSHYQRFLMHYATAYSGTGTALGRVNCLVASNRDLIVVRPDGTGSGFTEVHILSAASEYQTFTLHTATILPLQDLTTSFALGPNRDLYAIMPYRTGTDTIEVHVLSAETNYQSFKIRKGTPLGLDNMPRDVAVASNGDLYLIKTSRLPEGNQLEVEVAILIAAQDYQRLVLRTRTAFQPVEGDILSYAVASNRDLVMIREHSNGTTATEIQVLTAISGYQEFSLKASTVLRQPGDFRFGLSDDRSLFAIKTKEAESGAIEIHVLPDGYFWHRWMQTIENSTLLSDINLPGTHDSAAINTFSLRTPWACQNKTITEQLELGIRLLDIRLKAKWSNNEADLVTCHGDVGSGININEYQSFQSVLDECKYFLKCNPSECIVMSLKFDDWSEAQTAAARAAVLDVLKSAVSSDSNFFKSKENPALEEVRGRIVLLNRIDEELHYGVPISWTDNTPGMEAPSKSKRNYSVYVQDHYKDVTESGKLNDVWTAAMAKTPGKVVLNFGSAVIVAQLFGLYIAGHLLAKFGGFRASERPSKFGWLLFDYAFREYETDKYGYANIVDFTIASNFNYVGFEEGFLVPYPDG